MIPPSVSNFMPPDPTPAPQSGNDSRGAGDLFGDLLRNQLNVPAPGSSAGFSAPSAPAPSDPNPPQSLSNNPPPPPARNDDAGRSTPKSDSGSASAPPQQPASTAQSSSTSNSTDQNQQPTDSTNPATKSADGKPAGKKCSDEKNKSAKDDTNKTAKLSGSGCCRSPRQGTHRLSPGVRLRRPRIGFHPMRAAWRRR